MKSRGRTTTGLDFFELLQPASKNLANGESFHDKGVVKVSNSRKLFIHLHSTLLLLGDANAQVAEHR